MQDANLARQQMTSIDLRLAPRLNNYRSRVVLMLGLYNGSHDVSEGFDFAALGELFNNISNPDGLVPERVRLYELYFSAHQRLHETIVQCIADIDRSRYPSVVELLEGYRRALDATDFEHLRELFDAAVQEEREFVIDGKLRRKVPRQLQIAAHDMEGNDQPKILEPYVELYRLIGTGLRFQSEYGSAVGRIRER